MSSDRPNSGELVLDQLRSSLDGSRYSLSAVYAAIIVAFAGAGVVSLIVLALWHQLREVYAAKPLLAARMAKLKNQALTAEEKPKLVDCMRAVWTNNEEQMLAEHGLDAVIYLRALRMMRNIFILLTLLLFCVAAPINVVFNLHTKLISNLTKRDALLLLTPSLLSSTQMIPHVVLGWVTNACVLGVLLYNYRRVLAMREAYFADPQFSHKVTNRTLLVTNVPKSLRSEEGVSRVLEHANPRATPDCVSISRKLPSEAASLFDEHRNIILQLERELMTKSGSDRESALRADLNCIERGLDMSRLDYASNGLMGSKSRKMELSGKSSSSESYGFASYPSFRDAQSTAKRGKSHSLDAGVKLRIAPPPEQIVWKNLRLSTAERGTKQVVANVLYGVLVVVWIVPSAFIGCFLSNLSRLGSVWPAFGTAMNEHPIGFAILQGVLAPTITTAVFSALPFIFRRFSNMQGKVTRVDREREVLKKLYVFFFFDNYFVFTMMGVVWDVIAQVLQQTQAAGRAHQTLTFGEVWRSLRVASRIATAIVNISSFWVMYLLRAIFALFGSTAQPVTLCRRLGQRMNFVKRPTPRERAEADMPQAFQYATGYLSILFNVTVALGFTTIQPLVLPVTLILYALAVPVKKYEILHMQITKYESNGMFWPLVGDIVMFALAFGNLMLLCVIWVQGGWKVAVGACPLAATVIIFKIYVAVKFEGRFYYPNTIETPYDVKTRESDSEPQLSEVYADPVLKSDLEQPLLSYSSALAYYADIQNRQRPSYDGNNMSEVNSDAGSQSSKSDGGNPFGFRHVSIGAVRVGNTCYSPVEPSPAYAQEPRMFDRGGSISGPYDPYLPEETNDDDVESVVTHDNGFLVPYSETFGNMDSTEDLLKH